MPVKTKSYNDPIDDKEDGERYPKDKKNKKRISEEEYITRFNNEIMKNQNALRLLTMLRDKAIDNKENKKTITLLCIENEGQFCHRHIVKQMIENREYFTRYPHQRQRQEQ